MAEKKLETGELVFREGDNADNAYILVSGKVELIETSDGREVQIDIVEAGEAFGELAVFNPASLRPHSARTLEASTLASVSVQEFQSQFAQCPKDIQPLLHIAVEKMKATKVKIKASLADAVLESDITHITIAPASDRLKAIFKSIEVPVGRLPFRIGGYPEGGEASRRDQLHLSIPSQDNPLRVSRRHCEICIENKAIILNDLGSRFCTRVNGMIIGRGRGTYMAPLKKGANEVILGQADSPYQLTINCA